LIINNRAILDADVIALPIQGGWIVNHDKNLQQFTKTDLVSIERHRGHFGMASAAIAHLFVGRIHNMATSISRLDVLYTLELLINRFQAPEAPSQYRDFAGHDNYSFGYLPIMLLL